MVNTRNTLSGKNPEDLDSQSSSIDRRRRRNSSYPPQPQSQPHYPPPHPLPLPPPPPPTNYPYAPNPPYYPPPPPPPPYHNPNSYSYQLDAGYNNIVRFVDSLITGTGPRSNPHYNHQYRPYYYGPTPNPHQNQGMGWWVPSPSAASSSSSSSSSMPQYVEHQQAKTVKNDVNVHKDTIRLEIDEHNPDQYLVSFVFDAMADGRSYVISKLKDYPKFQAVAIAIQRSGFKIVLLLRLVPLLPFSMLNYLLSVTPVGIGEYMLASWLGMMPITLALVYVGTTLKDLSDVTHGWSKVSMSRWIFIISGFIVSAILMVCVTKVAKASLEKALAENPEVESILVTPQLPMVSSPPSDLHQPLVIKIDPSSDDHEK